MKTAFTTLAFSFLFLGCSGIQVAQTVPEAIQVYGTDCVKSGYEEGTDSYADCITYAWKMAEEREHLNQKRNDMLRLIRLDHKGM